MENKGKTITSVLANALMVFIGTYSILFGSITAFNVRLESGTVLLFCVLSSIVFSGFFFLEKYKKPIYIGTAVFLILFFLAYSKEIVDGFSAFLNIVTELFSRFSESISPSDAVHLTARQLIDVNTAFFSFLAVLFSFVFSFTLIKLHSIFPTLTISVIAFSLCLVFVKRVPDTVPVVMFFIFLTTLIMMSFVKQNKHKHIHFMYFVFLPLMLSFLVLISVIFPEGSYNRTDLAKDMYRYFATIFPLNSTKDPNTSFEESLDSSGTSESNESGEVSGDDTSGQDIDGQNNYNRVNLSDADPANNTDEIVMRIKSNTAGKILLRGFSLDAYSGDSWLKFNDTIKSNLQFFESISSFSDSYRYDSLATGSSLATYLAMTSSNFHMGQLEVYEEKTGGEVVYSPYFPVLTSNSNFVYNDDSAILYSNNYIDHRNVKASYSFNSFYCDDILAEIDYNNAERRTQQFLHVNELEERYSQYVNQYYTSIDNGTEDFLYDYIDGDSFMQINDREALVEAVRSYVKGCAKYKLDAKITPEGKDYVKFFLSESKEGYCMQFATTATLIFRTLGVPARYVSGFYVTVGTNQLNQLVPVTQKSAHAWVEVYFEGIGWIPVDVTPGFSGDGGTDNNSEDTTSHDTSSGTTSHDSSSQESDDNSTTVSQQVSSVDPSGESTATISSVAVEDSSIAEASSESENNIINIIIENKTVVISTSSTFLFCAIIATFILGRFSVRKKRRIKFSQSDTNRAAITAWNYITKLKGYGVVPEKEVYRLAQKATFSKHALTADEVTIITSYADQQARGVDKKLGFFKRIVFRYFKRLF